MYAATEDVHLWPLGFDLRLEIENASVFERNVDDDRISGMQLGFSAEVGSRDLQFILLIGPRKRVGLEAQTV